SRFLAHDEDRSVIATPRFISREMVEEDSFERSAVFAQQITHPQFHLRIPNIDVNFLALDKVPNEFRINWGHGVVFVVKTDDLWTRPSEPCADMRFPFSRHAVAESGGGSSWFVVRGWYHAAAKSQ